MPINQALQQLRQFSQNEGAGLEAPAIDPIMLIASMMAPGMANFGRAAVSRSAAVPPAFSQADMLAARLQAQARQRVNPSQVDMAPRFHSDYTPWPSDLAQIRKMLGVR